MPSNTPSNDPLQLAIQKLIAERMSVPVVWESVLAGLSKSLKLPDQASVDSLHTAAEEVVQARKTRADKAKAAIRFIEIALKVGGVV